MPVKELEPSDGVGEYILDSWKDFVTLTADVFATGPAYIFRGQAEYDKLLVSSIDRLAQRFPKRKNLSGDSPDFFECRPLSNENQLSAFKRALRGRRGNNPPILSDDDYWALGQHHGLSTPLLDFTRSPYVALFFAFEHAKVIIDGKLTAPQFRGVFGLSTATINHPDHPPEDKEDWVRIISPDSEDNPRLITQGGLFAMLPRDTDLELYIRKCFSGDNRRANYIKVKIPSSEQARHDCLVALNKMNINYMTLFPDIAGAARHVNSLWQCPGSA